MLGITTRPVPPDLTSALAARYCPFELRVSVMHASGHQSTQLSFSPGDIDIDIDMAATIPGVRPAPPRPQFFTFLHPLPHYKLSTLPSCAKSPGPSNTLTCSACVLSGVGGCLGRIGRRARQAHPPPSLTLSSSLPHARSHPAPRFPPLHLPLHTARATRTHRRCSPV